MLNLHPSS